jgi:hypothetical protein
MIADKLSVLCCYPTNVSSLCIGDGSEVAEPISAVSIIFSPMTSLTMTENVWKNLGVKNVSKLRYLRLSNSSFGELKICRNELDPKIPRSNEIKDQKLERRRLTRFVSSQSGKSLNGQLENDKTETEIFDCEEFVGLKRLDISGNQLKLLDDMKLPKLKTFQISGQT